MVTVSERRTLYTVRASGIAIQETRSLIEANETARAVSLTTVAWVSVYDNSRMMGPGERVACFEGGAER